MTITIPDSPGCFFVILEGLLNLGGFSGNPGRASGGRGRQWTSNAGIGLKRKVLEERVEPCGSDPDGMVGRDFHGEPGSIPQLGASRAGDEQVPFMENVTGLEYPEISTRGPGKNLPVNLQDS